MKKIKKILIPVALASLMTVSAFLVACKDKETTEDAWRDQSIWLQEDPLVPTDEAAFPEGVAYRTPSGMVHDPSIFHDPVSDAYYAYGTHYAYAKTFSLEDAFKSENDGGWKQMARDNDFEKLYGEGRSSYGGKSFPTAIQETVELVKPESRTDDERNATTWSTWAPDVEYINGKYYMYYSFTKHFGSNQSAIARVESDSPEGPFANNKIIIDSIGANGATDPNCIDPELFYDKDGKLWMVFGSASAGIFIKELETEGDNAGLPKKTKEEEGFGKLLWKAGGNAGGNEEGPFVFYNASTKYYYLMTSHASLMTNYNMHIARSQNPDGPYVGIDGKDVAEANGNGNLVSGNFKFDRGSDSENAFAAMGHNSVVKDKSGKYYVVYHARRYSDEGTKKVTMGHALYVSQMYFNEEGWPVMAATPYVGETRGTMAADRVEGDYDIVVHAVPTTTNNSTTFEKSSAYTLASDGKVKSGASEVGTWELKQGYYIEITLQGVTYKGVVAPGWDIYVRTSANQKAVVAITAVSNTGIPLWALQK